MRRELIAITFAGGLMAACVTPTTPPQWIQTGCGFLVLAEQVAALMAADPAIGSIEAALAEICQAAGAMSAARGAQKVTVHVHGVTLRLVRR